MASKTNIRNALQALGESTVGAGNAFIGKYDAFDAASLSAIRIYTDNDIRSYTTVNSTAFRTVIAVVTNIVEVYVRKTTAQEIEGTFDTLTETFCAAVGADKTLGGVVKDCQVTNITYTISGDGSKVQGFASMNVEATYSFRENII